MWSKKFKKNRVSAKPKRNPDGNRDGGWEYVLIWGLGIEHAKPGYAPPHPVAIS